MGSVIIVLHTRFPLVGKEFLQAHHISFFILLGEFKAQIPFHKSVSWSGGSVWTLGDSSSFKNLYPICKYSPHLETKTRIEYLTVLESGIFLIAAASCGMNIPSIMSLFHLLVSGSIKQSTVVSSLANVRAIRRGRQSNVNRVLNNKFIENPNLADTYSQCMADYRSAP